MAFVAPSPAIRTQSASFAVPAAAVSVRPTVRPAALARDFIGTRQEAARRFFGSSTFQASAAPRVAPRFSVNAEAKVILYAAPKSRSALVAWYLDELNVPHEIKTINLQAPEHKGDAFKSVNPFQKIPAITVEEDGKRFDLFESGAILTYLAQKFDKNVKTPEQVADVNKWVIFANASLSVGLFMEATRERAMPGLMGPLEEILSKQPWLLGNEISAADVAVVSYLYLLPMMIPTLDFSAYPKVQEYVKRATEREAFKKTIGNR
eukprot:tig00000881_g5247.t1